jgi:hypothetical protein
MSDCYDHDDDNNDEPMSPLLEGGNGKHKSRSQRVGFWKKIFKNKTQEDDNEPKEDLGLLSAPDLESDDDIPNLLSEPTRHRTGNINDSDSESDEEEDHLMQPPSHRSLQEDSDEEEGQHFLLVASGENSDEEDANSDGESSGSDDYEESESGDEVDAHEERDRHVSDALELEMETRPQRPFFQRSISSGSGYTDRASGYSDNAYSDHRVDSTDRKRVNDRIQGFGNSASARQPVPEDVTSPRTLREKIRAYRENRTKKMDIGRTSWKAKVEEFVVDIVDKTVPVFHNDRSRFNSDDSMPEDDGASTKRSTSDRQGIAPKRREFASDAAYILYLERELRNKDLEIASWKNQVNRLTGVLDDSSVDSDTSVHDQGESEIEWQTGGVAEEGILIDVSTPSDSQPDWASQEGDHIIASEGDEKVPGTVADPKPNPLGKEGDERVSALSGIKKNAILLKPPPVAPQRPEDDEFQWYSAEGVLIEIEDSSPVMEAESEETPSNGDSSSHEEHGVQGQPVNQSALDNTNDTSEKGQPKLPDRDGDCEKESPTEVAQVEPQDSALSNDTEIKDHTVVVDADESSEQDLGSSSEEDEDESESSEEDEDDEEESGVENSPKEGDLLELGHERKASHGVAGSTIADVGQETHIVSDEDDGGDSSSEDGSTGSSSARESDEEAKTTEGNLLDLDDDGPTASPQNASGDIASTAEVAHTLVPVLAPSTPYVLPSMDLACR